ncbi:PaaX family transcriptional regulator [Spiractinospora alimapuensis]|uniref:PaaX family transcriptional regulator n=1 Tax=Spiractinospora alimapuensis TaxID=2820884 RepID=UPI001F1B2540|nr:PaaX family transcriptional regulator C-terminal domain-containing protein [Spiractinospora alimapuensis]QVQ52851.1 PaaX family transcriptional regulator [Spiractinospora alimapuensis]
MEATVEESVSGRRGELRPQSLMLALLGEYVLDTSTSVFSGSFIRVFARAGISEQATRSTLGRMVRRDLLRRRRVGRRMYFGLTDRCEGLLRDGGRRVWELGVTNESAETEWTLIGFSLSEDQRRQRHALRTRLTWAGFGMLHGGLWLGPSRVGVEDILAELGLNDEVKVFAARPVPPTDIGELVREAYDLGAIAERYRGFLDRWSGVAPGGARDPLVWHLWLTADWLSTIREDPRLPLRLLPADWPADAAQGVFRSLHARWQAGAAEEAAAVLDTISTEPIVRQGIDDGR